jgi:hypothetical protein
MKWKWRKSASGHEKAKSENRKWKIENSKEEMRKEQDPEGRFPDALREMIIELE